MPHARRGRLPRTPVARVGVVGVLLLLAAMPWTAPAGPTGGQVVAGSGSIQRPDASTTLIQQQSQALTLDWTGFNVAAHERVQFQQPSSSAAALNRVFDELPSEIHGRLQANGRIFIMNPNGVVFGPGARVEVGALVASSLDIQVDDFMSGHYRFAAPEGAEPGLVANRGLISAATGGGVTLLGGAVRNEGVIVADLGHAALGAGRQALVDFDGDGLIRFQVDGALLRDVSGEGSAVANSGEIRADGGQVLLSAAVARGIFDRAINNEGVIRAVGIDRSAGTVRLSAIGGSLSNTGIIDVSALADGEAGSVALWGDAGVVQAGRVHADAAWGGGGQVSIESSGLTLLDTGSETTALASEGRGGSVQVLGDSVVMRNAARIDVSGDLGGGMVLLGGDYQGANPAIANARHTRVDAEASIRADATGTGDGGRIIVWSDERTDFLGRIAARGGPAGGDGGFAEVSGKASLAFRGSADLRAAAGSRGTLLLDPEELVITGGSGDGDDDDDSPTSFQGSSGASVAGEILFFDPSPSVVFESEIEAQSALSDISLQAGRKVSTAGTFDDGALVLAQDSSLVIEIRNIGDINAENLIDLTTSTEGAGLNIVTSGSGTISVRSDVGSNRQSEIRLPNLMSASDIYIAAGAHPDASVMVFGTVSGANVDVDAGGPVTVVSGGRVVAGGDGTALTIDASGITIGNGLPGAATVANSGAGTVSLVSSGAANIVLGESAIETGVGLLSLGSGRSIVAVNLTDVSDTVNEILSTGTVSLQASDDIGSADAHIEMAGVTDLIVDVGEGNIFLSGSDGLGGAGAPLKSLTLRLEPDEAGQYVVGNFADQTLAFEQGAFGDDLVIREITSATRLDLTVATRDDEGIRVGGGAGIQLAGGNVRLDSAGAINEAVPDDTVQVSAEITTDGRVTLVAVNGIGTSGMLDVAAGPGGVSSLEAASAAGAVRINGLDALRIEGSGIDAPGGGALAAARGLVIAANVESASDMTFTAASDAASAGNDVSIEAGALVRLDSAQSATLRFDAGDHIEFDGGSVETNGSATHRVELNADLENGGSDGVIGRVAQTGDASSVLGAHLSVTAGGGVGAGTALRTQVTSLSLDNTSAGEVQVVNAGDLDVVGSLRNQAPGEALVLVSEGGSLRLDGVVETSDGALTLKAGNAIQQLAGRIASASLRSESAGDTTLASADNTIARLSAKAGGSVVVQNGARLAVDETDVTGDLQIDNAQGLDIARTVVVGGRARLTTAAGNIDGAGGHIQAATLELDSASGIGIGAALETDIGADVSILSRGSGADGDIRIEERGSFDTQQLQRLATDAASAQTVSLRTQETLTVSRDPVGDPADLGSGDRLELDGARIELAANISARDVDVNFKAPVGVIGNSTINLDQGLLTFDENVSPASNTTLTLQSEVVFASGRVTGEPGSSLNIEGTLNLATDTTIEIDNLRLSGNPASLTGAGSLTLLPATHGKDLVLGGADGLVPDITLATLEGFGGGRALSIGVPARPTARSPFAGNVRVVRGLSVGDAALTIGGLGDVSLENHADALRSDRVINIVAIGDRRLFPNLVEHNGGDIVDSDATIGAPATLKAPSVDLIAQGRIGTSENALEVEVGPAGSVGFVTGATEAFINTIPAGGSVDNIVTTSEVLAAFQVQGFFEDALSQVAAASTVGLETTGLETTGLGELLYVDEGVFLLPDPYTTPVQATLLPVFMDPAFPADLRPDNPADEQAWQTFYSGVLRDYVQSRYQLSENATQAERDTVEARIDSEWRSLVEYFEGIRARELAAATGGASDGG